MKLKNKLELTWVGKNERKKIEPRILVENDELSYGNRESGNILIHGDNLLALKSLESDFSNKIKCVYIDPPYNTGAAFEHYDDNMEHSIWLSLMRERLILLYKLLKDDGVLCVQIDSVEMPYLKILLDELFGRKNFINIINVKAKIAGVSGSNLGKSLQDNVEYILMYAKNIDSFNMYFIPQKKQELYSYIKSYIEDGKSWKYTSIMTDTGKRKFIKEFNAGNGDVIKLYEHSDYSFTSVNQIAKNEFGNATDDELKKTYYKYIDKVFRTTNAQTSIRTKVIEETKEFNNGKGLFSIDYVPIKGKNAGKMTTFYYKDNNLVAWLNDVVVKEGNKIIKLDNMGNLWDDIQYNNLTKEGKVQFPNGKKPEAILERIIKMCTEENDYVLDSFLGSGTTCAVAQKMNRKWIGIEMGEQMYTHCIPRINAIINYEDDYGVENLESTDELKGYRLFELAPSLLNKDKFNNWVISEEYDADMLAEAMAKHNGFKYIKNQEVFYKQGYSSEKDFIFTTTNYISLEYLDMIYDLLDNDETLLICCKTYQEECENKYRNITIQKIPQSLIRKYEFGDVNYTFNLEEIIENETDEGDQDE